MDGRHELKGRTGRVLVELREKHFRFKGFCKELQREAAKVCRVQNSVALRVLRTGFLCDALKIDKGRACRSY